MGFVDNKGWMYIKIMCKFMGILLKINGWLLI